jgi:hypothetical protein
VHTVHLTYHTPGWDVGLGISAAGLLLAAVGLALRQVRSAAVAAAAAR